MRKSAYIILVITLFISINGAHGHNRSESYSNWHIKDNHATATITVPLREIMALYQINDTALPPIKIIEDQLITNISVNAGNSLCTAHSINALKAPSDYKRIEIKFLCPPKEEPDRIKFRGMFEVSPTHINYSKLYFDGQLISEFLFNNNNDTWFFSDLSNLSNPSFYSFFFIGLEHITGGIDHIAFLLGLLLIAKSSKRILIAITGFTLGHSISLGAAVLGYLHADSKMVEAFIGFTVMLVAIEFFLIREKNNIHPWAIFSLVFACSIGLISFFVNLINEKSLLTYFGFGVFAYSYLLITNRLNTNEKYGSSLLLAMATFSFGLVHGFGFAGFLMETGILGISLFKPLLGFNLGVEAGQIILVILALTVINFLKDYWIPIVFQFVASSLCAIGVFWFVSRTFS